MASTGSPTVDVLIIGGGPAGLSTALSLSRLRLTAVLFDSGLYRNAATDYIHNISTWDHQDPTTYRPVARAELTNGRYKTVGFANMAIVSVPKDETGSFKAVDATGKEWTVNVLAIPSMTATFANHVARLANQFAKRVVSSTNESESLARDIQALVAPPLTIHLDSRPIARLTTTNPAANITNAFTNGGEAHHAFLVHTPETVPDIDFASGLGLELTEAGTEVKTSLPFYESSLKGCFAVGDYGYALFKSLALEVAPEPISGADVVGQILLAD